MQPGVAVGLAQLELGNFQKYGHVATRGLVDRSTFAAVAAPLQQLAEEEEHAAATRKSQALRGGGDFDADARVAVALPFVQVHNPHQRCAAARRLAFSPSFLAVAAALLGVASVRLYQDNLFLKRPGCGDTAWHADLWTVPISTNNFVSVWMPLHRVDEGRSPLYYHSGTHLFPDPDVAFARPGVSGEHHAPMDEGDATWHHGWTIHGAPPLKEGESRLAYTAAYYADDAPVVGDALDALASRRRSFSMIDVDYVAAR